MKLVPIILGLLVLASCNKKPEQSDLERFIVDNHGRSEDFLIACAAGNMNSFMGDSETPIHVFFYKLFNDIPKERYC